jgi:hypothetical protein
MGAIPKIQVALQVGPITQIKITTRKGFNGQFFYPIQQAAASRLMYLKEWACFGVHNGTFNKKSK